METSPEHGNWILGLHFLWCWGHRAASQQCVNDFQWIQIVSVFTVRPLYPGKMMQTGLSVNEALLDKGFFSLLPFVKSWWDFTQESYFGFLPLWECSAQRTVTRCGMGTSLGRDQTLIPCDAMYLMWLGKSAKLHLPCFPLKLETYNSLTHTAWTHERLIFRSKENKRYLSIWNMTLGFFLFALIFVSFGKNWN